MKKNLIFLIGGHDLEMQEITNILESLGIKYYDFNLAWGAKLSSYKDVFDDEHTFVGIELIVDCGLPKKYIEIDHHNQNSFKLSSIEQVAEMLDIKLTWWQQLVAANDRGYIPAMEEMGASRNEITEIRKADRSAQGVKISDETLAKVEITMNFRYIRDIGVIRTSLNRFSPVTDQLYRRKSKLIVYNDRSVNYYGIKAENTAKQLLLDNNFIKAVYFGGGPDGYLGIELDKTPFTDTETIINILTEMAGAILPKSVHCFLFPFRWEYKQQGVESDKMMLEDRHSLNKIEDRLKKSGWVRSNKYKLTDSHLNYNEYLYYHDFVREVIFDTEETLSDPDVMRYFRFESLSQEAKFIIEAKPWSNKGCYELALKGLHLHIYKSGVGVLGIDLENYKSDTTDSDILAINEYGRRIYPQFIGEGFDLNPTRNAFLASKITVSIDGITNIEEDFSGYSGEKIKKEISNKRCVTPPKYIAELFHDIEFKNKLEQADSGIFIDHLTDDRMFTICWYGNNELADKLGKRIKTGYGYEESDWWYCYLFGDKEWPSIANKLMKKQQIQEFTYARWAEYGTLYGITRDTFVAVSSDVPTLERSNSPNIRDHILTIYYQMATLGLVQRASILKFSGAVSNLDDVIKAEKNEKSLVEKVKWLYAAYIEFINKIFFREVSSQIQAIEMYRLMHKAMNIEKEVTDLDNEISELHNYISMIQDAKRNEQSNKLNFLAALFLPASFITAVLGIGFIGPDSVFKWLALPNPNVWNSLLLIIIGGAISSLIAVKWLDRNLIKNKHFILPKKH